MKKIYEKLKFTDDFAFCHILKDNEEICKKVTELVTGRKVRKIINIQAQKSIKESLDGKGVRFDVFFEDEDSVYDIEMQTYNEGGLPQRARYYHSLGDLTSLKEGEEYGVIKNSFVIFICTFDPFGAGEYKYIAKSQIIDHPEILYDDGQETVFISSANALKNTAEEDIPSEMKAFLTYLQSSEATDDLTKLIDESLISLLDDTDRRSEYMTLEEIKAIAKRIGKEEGLEEGHRLHAENTARAMLADDLPIETIAKYTGLAPEEIEQLKGQA